jgi:formylglycine-generating enzyme required for sulfatase activity
MPRLFISHSSSDDAAALAFLHWLTRNGWNPEDVFLDLHTIRAGERWRDSLRKAGKTCEAVILLASPASLASKECLREIYLAEDLGKEIIVAILKDLRKDDPRIISWADRQLVDLSELPTTAMAPVEHQGRTEQLAFHLPALESIRTRLWELGIAPDSFAWKPRTPTSGPYPGLAAFEEDDAAIFFGREEEIATGLEKLRLLRIRGAPRALVIQAASGAGKSSFLRAGLWPRLRRDPDFIPLVILRPALGIISGPDGVGRKLAEFFANYGETRIPGEIAASLREGGPASERAFRELLSAAAAAVDSARCGGRAAGTTSATLIAIDQGEEMFTAENSSESRQFIDMLASVLRDPPPGMNPYVIVAIRADSVEALLQRWPTLGLAGPEAMLITPLSPTAYRDVILKPAGVFSNSVRPLVIEPGLVSRMAGDATGADALPLLAFTLERLFSDFGADGKITLDRYDAIDGIGGSIDRSLAAALRDSGPIGTHENLRRLLIPSLATWSPTAKAAIRRVAIETNLLSGKRRSLGPLADTLVANRLLTKGADTLEVAHEALLRRQPISAWLETRKNDLALRDQVLAEATAWGENNRDEESLVRRGARLESALALQRDVDFATALEPAKDYLAACLRLATVRRRMSQRVRAAVTSLLVLTIALLLGVIFKSDLQRLAFEWTTVRTFRNEKVLPYVVSRERAGKLSPGATFRDCAANCPEMTLVPSGSFRMGSPDVEKFRKPDEGPLRMVTIATLAVGTYEVTWDEWETCVAMQGCDGGPTGDAGYGKGRKPVINVSWDQASAYVAWLSRMTGAEYRLLTESEWEYVARADSSTVYWFGDAADGICKYANLADRQFLDRGYTGEVASCDDRHIDTAPVGSFPANAFGIHDMLGNVFEWTGDCYVSSYDGARTDGSAAPEAIDCPRVLRGGSWANSESYLRAARRGRNSHGYRSGFLGFRVARKL